MTVDPSPLEMQKTTEDTTRDELLMLEFCKR